MKRIVTICKQKNRAGFTLLEVLLAVLMMSLISLIAFSTISTASKAYMTYSLRTQAQIFLTENVTRISHMLRYADAEVGVITPSSHDPRYSYPGDAGDARSPVFAPREQGGYVGYFRNNNTTGEIDFVSIVDDTVQPVVKGSNKHYLKAHVEFSEDMTEDKLSFNVTVTAFAGEQEAAMTFRKGTASNDDADRAGAYKNDLAYPDCESGVITVVPIEATIRKGLS